MVITPCSHENKLFRIFFISTVMVIFYPSFLMHYKPHRKSNDILKSIQSPRKDTCCKIIRNVYILWLKEINLNLLPHLYIYSCQTPAVVELV